MDAKLIKRFDKLPHDWQEAIENVLRLCLDSAEKQIKDGLRQSATPAPSGQPLDVIAPTLSP